MTLRNQLFLAFGIVAAIPLVGGAIGIYAQAQAARQARQMVASGHEQRRVAEALENVDVVFKAEVQDWKNLLLRGHDRAAYDTTMAAFRSHPAEVKAALDTLTTEAQTAGFDVASIAALQASFTSLHAKYETALRSFSPDDALSYRKADALARGADRELGDELAKLSHMMTEASDKRIDAELQALEDTRGALQLLMIVGTVIGVILGVFFGWMTSNAVVRHLRELTRKMQGRTETVAAAANQVTASSSSVAAASSEQATTVESSSATLVQVSARVKENADRARKAQDVSSASRNAAEKSATEIAELQAAMHASVAAAGNIKTIIKSIDEIAFQTNLLALNAAVEAARAGEAGAGFAVVADEVRSLAQRSAKAARETADRIEDATEKSARSAELADRVGKSLAHVLENTRTVDTLVHDITQASAEQASGLDQAVASIERIDRLTQSNAASAEETAAAARGLDEEITALRHELASVLDRRAAITSAANTNSDHANAPLAA